MKTPAPYNGGPKILIIEDEDAILETLKTFLTSEGYDVQTAENGLAAMHAIEKHGLPHLILLDMKMPIMNGWQFAKEFTEAYDHLAPIIVMTAAADASQRAAEVHASAWLGKPFELDELLKKLQEAEAQRRTSTQTNHDPRL